jgi:hypothetical protein
LHRSVKTWVITNVHVSQKVKLIWPNLVCVWWKLFFSVVSFQIKYILFKKNKASSWPPKYSVKVLRFFQTLEGLISISRDNQKTWFRNWWFFPFPKKVGKFKIKTCLF